MQHIAVVVRLSGQRRPWKGLIVDARSEGEFTEFVGARSPALLGAARVLTGDRHQAEDLVQSALTKLAVRWHRIDDPEAYVRRIIYHDQVSWWRRRGKLRDVTPLVTTDHAVGDRSVDVDRRLDLSSALGLLAPRQRAVLVLRYLEDLPDAQIATILDCSLGTVRSQAHRGLTRLRELVPDLADNHPFTSTGNKE